jgi:hypothetical protein
MAAVLVAALSACGSKSSPLRGDGGGDAVGDATGSEGGPGLDAAGEGSSTIPDAAPEAAADQAAVPDAHELNDAGGTFVAAVASFCQEKARHVCAKAARCRRVATIEADCLSVEERACAAALGGAVESAASRGRLTFDPANAVRCLAGLDEADCDDPFSVEACTHVAVGKLPDGAACLVAEECAGGWCLAGDTNACGGTCGSPSLVGGPCWSYLPGCDRATAWCDYMDEVCKPKRERGAPCNDNELAYEFGYGQCQRGDFCMSQFGWACRGADRSACRCAALRPTGAACIDASQCERPLGCVEGKCRAPGASGAGCNFGRGGGCVAGYVCVKTGVGDDALPVGVCRPPLADGQPCFSTSECGASSWCWPKPAAPTDLGTCGPGPRLGEPCDVIPSCPTGAFCDDSFKVCKARPRDGEPCAGGGVCLGDGLGCYLRDGDIKCGPPLAVGDPCNGQCGGALYCDAQKKCAPRRALGAECASGDECTSGRCQAPDGRTCHGAACAVKTCVAGCGPESIDAGT